jgi:uncharacterized protein YcfL
MKRVIIVSLVCVAFLAQGCSAHKTQVTHQRAFVLEPSYPRPGTQASHPREHESEEIVVARLEAITTAVLVAGRVAVEVLRVIR